MITTLLQWQRWTDISAVLQKDRRIVLVFTEESKTPPVIASIGRATPDPEDTFDAYDYVAPLYDDGIDVVLGHIEYWAYFDEPLEGV